VNVKDENVSSERIVPGFGDMSAERRIGAIGNLFGGSSENVVYEFVSIAGTIGVERNLANRWQWRRNPYRSGQNAQEKRLLPKLRGHQNTLSRSRNCRY